MNKKQLHEQSLKELRKLEYIFEEESSARPVATSVKNHLESLGYETKRTMAEVGDLTPEFGDTLKDVASAFKEKLPDLKIKFGSGRDLFHKKYPNSRHNKGNAIDVVFKGIEKGDNDELDKISTLLCALRKKYPGFTFIDEYRRPSRFSTGVHYHLSYSDSKTDEGGGTSQFCSSLKNLDNLDDIDFEKIGDSETTKDPSKLEKFLDYIGLGTLTDIKSGDKESQKELVSKVQDKKDVKDTDDGFEIFGYNVDDIINKIDDFLPQFESEQKKKNLLETLAIRDISGMSTYKRKNEKLKSRDFFVIHHTAGRGDAEKVVGILNSRKGGLGVQWVIERDGSIVRTLPDGSRGAHTLNSSDFPSAPQGISNSNSEGVEVIGMNDDDILPVQAVSALKLVKSLGYSPDSIYGHGEINPGHKAKTEGQTIKQFILKNWNNSESDYDFSMFDDKGIDIEYETKSIKQPSKLDAFLDSVGLGSLTDAKAGDKESQKELISKVEDKKDVKDTGDGFEIFGYSVDDILDKIEDFLPQFESEQEKKNLLEDIERIKSKMIK
jgi:soluble cytochrome b562